MEIINTNYQLQVVLLSYCTQFNESNSFKYMDSIVDAQTSAEFIYPIVCYLCESEFTYYFDKQNLEESKPLFTYTENLHSSMFKPISVNGTEYLKDISFSMIAPFFFFWLKNLIDKYYNQLELVYIHFRKESIFKN